MSSNYLFVGDPHAEPGDMNDVMALGAFIIDTAKATGATVVLAGDLYHTHAIIHADVQYFWWVFFDTLQSEGIECITKKGNHDGPGTVGSRATALIAHVKQCSAVLYEPLVRNGILFCPYTSGSQLVEWSQAHPECQTLFCHQTFDGSTYENGFYAGDGVDPNLIAQKQVISGHIHTPQEFGKIWYPGAPRWRTLSDANTKRALWLLEFDDAGKLVSRTPYDTGAVCRQIFHHVDTPANPLNIQPLPNSEYRIDVMGPETWIKERLPLFEGWARTRRFCTDSKIEVQVKESEGVGVAFGKWLDVFQPRHGTEKVVLKKLVEERLHGF